MSDNPEPVAPAKAPGTYDWRIWYTIIIVGLSVAAIRGAFPEMLYLIVGNWLLWFIPALLIVRATRSRRK